jgi:hypothetical protein
MNRKPAAWATAAVRRRFSAIRKLNTCRGYKCHKWQEDLLGLQFLLPGRSVSVDVDDRNGNCRVDVKTVLSNGSSLVYRGVNACLADGHAILIR